MTVKKRRAALLSPHRTLDQGSDPRPRMVVERHCASNIPARLSCGESRRPVQANLPRRHRPQTACSKTRTLLWFIRMNAFLVFAANAPMFSHTHDWQNAENDNRIPKANHQRPPDLRTQVVFN